MEYTFILTGHPNISSKHKTTLELTKDTKTLVKPLTV